MPGLSTHAHARAWVEVDLDAARENLALVRAVVGRAAVVPMVKAGGYGLGAVAVARALEPAGPWGFGVATLEEGLELREAGVRLPILVTAPLPPGAEPDAVAAGLTPTLSDLAGLRRLASAAAERRTPVDAHVEVDTGMGRCGFAWQRTERWTGELLAELGGWVRWTGIFTHFQAADEPDPEPTREQWRRFRSVLDIVARARASAGPLPPGGAEGDAPAGASGGVDARPLLVHAANSAAAFRFPEVAADAVRPGIALYGGVPGGGRLQDVPRPRTVAAVRARVLLLRDVPAGATAGYGATHRAERPSRWGTLGIGYGDGLPRALGNRGSALVRGRRVPIVGRVSMDLTVVDLTEVLDARVGDVATLVGEDGDERITLEEVAELAGTISYEILTGLTPRLPRRHRGAAPARLEEVGPRAWVG